MASAGGSQAGLLVVGAGAMVTAFASARADWSGVTREVKRGLPMRQVLRVVGWKMRSRNRADCGLCQAAHSQYGTVSFNDAKGVWHCFRCGAGGSVIDLVMLEHNCDFLTALKFLAAEARVELPSDKRLNAAERARLHREAAERQQCERELDEACAEFERRERELRKQCRERIYEAEKTLYKSGPWSEQDWQRAKTAFTLRESLLVEYSLLSFGQMDERLHYLISDDRERARILATVRWAGGIATTDGYFVEIGRLT